jgi:hypothetical protein
MATTFSKDHRVALQAHGVTDAQCQQLAAAGCDPDKCVAALPQLRQQVEAAGFDFQKWIGLFMQLLPILIQFFHPTPAPQPGPTPAQR